MVSLVASSFLLRVVLGVGGIVDGALLELTRSRRL
jgi:hypothetical protein